MKTFTIAKKTVVTVASLLLMWGCTLNISNSDLYSDPDAINTVSTARSLLAEAYGSVPHYEYELSVLGNDFCPTTLTGKDMSQQNLYRWQEKALTDLATQAWLAYYHTITLCDVLLERLPNVETPTHEDECEKTCIRSEAEVLKALCYFRLLQLFAPAYDLNPEALGVVIKTKIGVEQLERESIKNCVGKIRTWLTQAAECKFGKGQNGWLSQKAALYLLAELELYTGNYEQAAMNAEKVLKAAGETSWSKEAITQIWSENPTTHRIFAFYATDTYYANIQYDEQEGDYFALSPEVTFEQGDARETVYTYHKTMDGEQRRLLGKYNRNNKEGRANTYIDMLRPAGACLIAAEAYAHLPGKNQQGLEMLNRLRATYGLKALQAQTSEQLLQAVRDESRKEFVGEGKNFLNLKRTHATKIKRARTWGKGVQNEIAADDYRWTLPIPPTEYKTNTIISQNKGWPINR